jgi:FkbM family methyltransferase
MPSFQSDTIASRLALGAFTPEQAFLAALELYRHDRLFAVPAKTREIIARRGADTAIVLLGRSDFGGHLIHALRARARVLCVVDDFRAHRGEQFHGLDFISSDRFLEMARQDPDLVGVNACRSDYSRRFFDGLCRDRGIALANFEQIARAFDLNAVLDHRVHDWGAVIAARAGEYQQLVRRMADPYSADTLHAVLTFHLTGNPEWFLNVARPYSTLYVRSGLFALDKDEKMVDCGASIGESTTALMHATEGSFARSWMIEPDRINVATLQGFMRKYAGTAHAAKMSLHPVAVGDVRGRAPFEHLGHHGGSVLPPTRADACPEADYVAVERIDDIVDDAPTIIKMDIEGFELPALKGAERTIRAARPKLLVSAYHRSADLLDIPAWIDSIAADYRIGLRHHTEDRWDTCLYFY